MTRPAIVDAGEGERARADLLAAEKDPASAPRLLAEHEVTWLHVTDMPLEQA